MTRDRLNPCFANKMGSQRIVTTSNMLYLCSDVEGSGRRNQDVAVYKAIRLETINVQGETVNIPWPFWSDAVEDDFVVICAENIVMLCLHFEGNNCSAWNERQCKDHCDTIAQALRMLQIDSKLAKKIRRGVLQKKCSSKRENKRRKFKQMKDERVTL